MGRKKLRRFTVNLDAKYSFDVEVKAETVAEAKQKALDKFLRSQGKKKSNWRYSWVERDKDGYEVASGGSGY